jgi:hypothetical protein
LDRERRLSDTDKIGRMGSRGNTFNGQREEGRDSEYNGWRSTAETPIHIKKT